MCMHCSPPLSRKWLKNVECVGGQGGGGVGGGGGGGGGEVGGGGEGGGEDPDGLKLILPSRILITHSFHCSQGKYKNGKNKYKQKYNTQKLTPKNKPAKNLEESNQNVGMGFL